MRDSFYVDDCISSVESEEEAARFKQVGVSTLASRKIAGKTHTF